MHNTVRRMRLAQLSKVFPALIPGLPDDGARNSGIGPATSHEADELQQQPPGDNIGQHTVVIDMGVEAASLAKGKAAPHSACSGWEHKHRAALASAMNGGQWPQCRKASVPAWGISDKTCQLCGAANGTALHRHTCTATLPPNGWLEEPENVVKLRAKLTPKRRELLDTRGLFAIKLRKPSEPQYDTFSWLSQPPDTTDTTLRWYIDGSMVNGTVPALATMGFAIVVTDRHSNLLAWGHGIPPQWITDAAGAEAWALALVTKMCPAAPRIITDCKGLLGEAAAASTNCSAKKKLARTWRHILQACDGDTSRVIKNHCLNWMPAHTSAANATERKMASGKEVSIIDWRANTLADHLARNAAESSAPPKRTVRLVKDAVEMVKCAAAKLGMITWAANNHEVVEIQQDGSTKKVLKRDSTEPLLPRSTARRQPKEPAPPRAQTEELLLKALAPSKCTRKHRLLVARAAAKKAAVACEKERQDMALLSAVNHASANGDCPVVMKHLPARGGSCNSTSRYAGSRPPAKSWQMCTAGPPCENAAGVQPLPGPMPRAQLPSGLPLFLRSTSTAVPVVSSSEDEAVDERSQPARPAVAPPACLRQNSTLHELFNGRRSSSPGITTAMPVSGEQLDDLLELARLEAAGCAVRWPPLLSACLIVEVRAHAMAT